MNRLVVALSACVAVALAGLAGASGRAKSAAKPIAADLYVDMEAGAPGDAVDVRLLDAMTHGTGGAWSLRRGPGINREGNIKELTVAAMKGRLPVPVVVGGVTYPASAGTRGWACDMLTPLRTTDYIFDAPHRAVSVGFFFEHHATIDYSCIDLVTINARNGDFCVMQTWQSPGKLAVRVHTGDHWDQGGGSKTGILIPIEAGKRYWASMRFVQHGECSLSIYDPVTFEQVGPTSTLTLTSDSPAANLMVGRTDNHGVMASTPTYWDDLVVDWSHAAYPLRPDLGGPGSDRRSR